MYTLHITLQERTPTNERTLQIDTNASFATLAQAICELYGLHGGHLREFIQKNKLCINHPEISIDKPIDTDIFGDDIDLNDPELLDPADNTLQLSSVTYRLDEYFSKNTEILFAYDFLAGWKFTIQKIWETNSNSWSLRQAIDWNGTYLLEDSGGPEGLKDLLSEYKKKKFDEDARETFEDFAEWIQPALISFDIKKI